MARHVVFRAEFFKEENLYIGLAPELDSRCRRNC
jgi:hypothetical protein